MGNTTIPQVADLTIEMLATEDAMLVERAVDLTLERDRYRELLQESLTALHHVIRERDRLRLAGRDDFAAILADQSPYIVALRAECDALREQLGLVEACV